MLSVVEAREYIIGANAFLIASSEVKSLPAGTELEAWLIGDLNAHPKDMGI